MVSIQNRGHVIWKLFSLRSCRAYTPHVRAECLHTQAANGAFVLQEEGLPRVVKDYGKKVLVQMLMFTS